MKNNKFFKRFYHYQQERFPILVLAFSLFPAILSSSVVIATGYSKTSLVIALLGSIMYLLHIRILDEYRDYDHDTIHHKERPIQQGIITLSELQILDTVLVITLGAIGLMYGIGTSIFIILMLAYSYIAGKEFFMGDRFKKYFFLYNSANLLQMILMQCFVYSIFTATFPTSSLVYLHFLFITLGTVIFELIRKIKNPGDDGTGKDTYSWHLGFAFSLYSYVVMLLLGLIVTIKILLLHQETSYVSLLVCTLSVIMTMVIAVIHLVKKTVATNQMLQLSFLLCYTVLHLSIYYIYH